MRDMARRPQPDHSPPAGTAISSAARAFGAARRRRGSEEWNTAFGAASLYEAFTQLPDAQNICQANRSSGARCPGDARRLAYRRGRWRQWRVMARLLRKRSARPLHACRPTCRRRIRSSAGVLPARVAFHSVVAPIQEAELPDADVVTCSLVVHHIAGLDANERRQYGLSGTGKRETLRTPVVALRARQGIGILTEADTCHDLALPPERTAAARTLYGVLLSPGRHDGGRCNRPRWTQMQRCASAGRSSCAIGSSTRSIRPSFRWRSVTSTSWMLRAGGNSA